MLLKSVLIVSTGILVAGGVVLARRATVNATARTDHPPPGDGASDERELAMVRSGAKGVAPIHSRSLAPLPSVPPPAPAPVWPPEVPVDRPATSRRELVAGVEQGREPAYLAVVRAAFGYLPELTEEEKTTLMAIAKKRVRVTRAKMKEGPDSGGESDLVDAPDLRDLERTLLGDDRYRDYRSAVDDVLARQRSAHADANQKSKPQEPR